MCSIMRSDNSRNECSICALNLFFQLNPKLCQNISCGNITDYELVVVVISLSMFTIHMFFVLLFALLIV